VQRSRKRFAELLIALVVVLVGAALLYEIGMYYFEGKPRTFLQALEWSAATISTTGYGETNWDHPMMVVLVVITEFIGIFMIPIVIIFYLVPMLSDRFEQRVPRETDEKLANHVIVFRYGPAVETLLQRLASAHVPSLVVEIDEMAARAVMETGQRVVFSRSEEDALDVARISKARAVVANGRDQENAALILRARQTGFRGEIYSFVEEPAHRKAMELAGATAAYTPRHIVAAALAAHASERISPRLPGLDRIAGMQRREVRVPPDSALAGKRFGELALDAIVVGQWMRSHLLTPCTPDMTVEPGAVIELVGDAASLHRAASAFGGSLIRNRGPILIAGFGEVGRKVHELLKDADEELRVIERYKSPDVDVAGDVLDSSVLERAGLAEARSLILALDSDDSTLFATVIARDAAPDVAIYARVNHARNLENIHRAGADYALSISDVSGEMLSTRLLGGTRARDERRKVERLDARSLAGLSMQELKARDGACSILAVEPGGIWVCGTTDAIRSFAAQIS
jgi:Trk K+ transport system NAD-binding subunit